ncbi:SPFH domain / Band 7 family protein [Cognatiyoonia koreensis]|uniref:SPFH domain / Band 7 family protein n=1 Tax=Cognatiyoonia koreensis TaxID=364200 RepID=A0A1I0RX05_9RHOB|nr:SPFH domain-containing protein [Cognatiyoonia koreensis]SEW46079.1 SPFH domain / Band 7 family protein [Cognatiyoonia koreensis]
MAHIKRYIFANQLRAEASQHIQYFRKGTLRKSGRGLSFWFDPNGASLAEIPMNDRELIFMIKGQSSDYQDLAVQGSVIWRVADADKIASRVDFGIDVNKGVRLDKPEEQIKSVLTGLVRTFADAYLKDKGVRELLEAGLSPVQAAIAAGFNADPTLDGMGLEVVSIRVAALSPSSELYRALQAPTFESLQQKADEATFSRRALAVDKERAIAENELQNQIELASRRKDLIAREDANARSEAEAKAAAKRITVEAESEAKIIGAEAEAKRIRAVEQAAADMEKARMSAIADVPPAVMFALAAQEFASKLEKIDSLNISPDMLASLFQQARQLMGPPAREI